MYFPCLTKSCKFIGNCFVVEDKFMLFVSRSPVSEFCLYYNFEHAQ